MTAKVGTIIVYVNADGSTESLVAEPEPTAGFWCNGCIGQRDFDRGSGGPVCRKLPSCCGVVWKEVVQ